MNPSRREKMPGIIHRSVDRMVTFSRLGAVVRVAIAAAVASFVVPPAPAQNFPSKPIQIVVPVGAGGINDIISRLIGQKLTERWDQPVVILNKPGAGGIIGTEFAAKSPPDGYTMVMVYSSHFINPSLYAKLPYDTIADFAPITMVNTVDLVLVVNTFVAAKSVPELIALAKSEPGKLNYGAVGTGSLGHLAAIMFGRMTSTNIMHVPYKSAPEVSTALLKGDATMFFDSPISALPLLKAGKTRAIGVTSAKRSSVLPDVPTLAESGVPGYEVVGWNGLVVPAGTARPIVTKLNAEIVSILHSPDVVALLKQQGVDAVGGSAEEFAKAIRTEIAKWSKIIKQEGIRLE
jgi:tripartite-type tricarboxylate transporter receptor subunit TctC